MPASRASVPGLAADWAHLLRTMPWGVLVLTGNGRVALLNAEAEALWGVPAADVLGLPPASVQPAVLPAELVQALVPTAGPAAAPADFWLPHVQRWITMRTATGPDGGVWVYWEDVTARRQAEEAARRQAAAEQQTRELLLAVEDVARTGSYEGDLATMTFRFSDGLFRLFGEAPQAFEPPLAWIDARSHSDDVPVVKAVLDQAIRNREPYRYVRRIYRPTGALRTLEAHGTVICDAAGQPVKLLGLVQDITERQEAEEAVLAAYRQLLQANATVAQMLSGAIAAISFVEAVRDEHGQLVDFAYRDLNTAAETLHGLPVQELRGKRMQQVHPAFAALVQVDCARVLATGEACRVTYCYPQEHRWIDLSAVRNGDGLILTVLDITALKQAEQQAQDSQRLAEQIMEATPDFIMVFDFTVNRTVFVNRSAYQGDEARYRETLQLSYEQLLARAHPEDQPALRAYIEGFRTADDDAARTVEYRVLRDGQERWYRASGKVFQRDAQQRPLQYISVVQDISTRRLAKEQQRQQQQALFNAVLAAQETERKRIAEGLHNGVGQLLYATKLQLDQLRAADPPAALTRAHELLGKAIRQTRAISHELVPAVLSEFGLAGAIGDICRQGSSKSLRFECFVEEETPLPQPLQLALYRMAQELALNILKHAHATEASLAVETVPGFVLLRAEDNGVGFPADPSAAAGLGLRSIRDRVALLGGEMEVGSSPAAGTYVRIRLPLPV